ncbi:MAG: tetratricopeptide repeat protein, partial [Candidatus Heimdallarchaeota archaeon]
MRSILSNHPWLSQLNTSDLEKLEEKITVFELESATVVDWFSNFGTPEEFELALKIFHLIDYRTSKRTIETIKTYKTQIKQSMESQKAKNLVLVSSDQNTDSSNRFIYDLGKEWGVAESNVFRKSELTKEVMQNKDNFFIFFNDTHGTGNQFVGEFKTVIDDIGQSSCAIISITMTAIALERFKKEFSDIALVQPSFQSIKNIEKHQDETTLNTQDIRLLKELGKKVYSKGVLGYKDTGLLIAYAHQCPNNTLPIIWANGKNNEVDGYAYPWSPLFEYKKVKEKKQNNTDVEVLKTTPVNTSPNSPKLLTTLPPRNPEFVGRVKELKEIEEHLASNSLIYIVNGIGGVGKSELSYEYLHEHKEKYNNIAFMELTSDTSSLEELFIIKFKEEFQLDSFDSIMRRLQEFPGKNLLLLDNLEKREDFEKLKPLNTNFDLLITTRLKDIDTKNQLNLETLNDEDAKELFLSIYDEDENIDDILKYLDNHPLFINLTAKSLKLQYITLKELRDDIDSGQIMQIDSKDDKTFQEHLRNRFNKQFEDEKNEELKELLQQLAIFPSIEIDFLILVRSLNVRKAKLQKLVDRGWLSQKDNSYKLHQIIKTFMLAEHPSSYEDVSPIFERVAKYIDPNDSTLIASSLSGYIPVIESLLRLFGEEEDKKIAGILDSMTYLYYSLGQYNDALRVQKISCTLKEKLLGTKDAFTAESYNLLGIIYEAQGKYLQALPLSEKALKIKEEVLGEDHPRTAISYNNLALLYWSMGAYEKAEPFYHKALKINEKVLGEEHPDTSRNYNNLAGLYKSMGAYGKAELLYDKALKIREKVLGEEHPDTATSYNNLAGLYKSMGAYGKAE